MEFKKYEDVLWTERFRAKTIAGVILPPATKKMFKQCIAEKDIPNFLFESKTPGTGKTTTAKALLVECGYDYIYINASLNSGIDAIRTTIVSFASQYSYDGSKKAVILDEADGLSRQAQEALRGVIEEFHDTCRFIFTCNYRTKILEPIRSRLTAVDFNFNDSKIVSYMKPLMVERLEIICKKTSVEYVDGVLERLVDMHYPDMRSMINDLNASSREGGVVTNDALNCVKINDTLIELIDARQITKARQYIIDNNYDYDELYPFLFRQYIPKCAKGVQGPMTIAVASYMRDSVNSFDKEVTFVACLFELLTIMEDVS